MCASCKRFVARSCRFVNTGLHSFRSGLAWAPGTTDAEKSSESTCAFTARRRNSKSKTSNNLSSNLSTNTVCLLFRPMPSDGRSKCACPMHTCIWIISQIALYAYVFMNTFGKWSIPVLHFQSPSTREFCVGYSVLPFCCYLQASSLL